jgi:hypothetical protein
MRRLLIGTAVVVIALFVVVDRIGVRVAQNRVAADVRRTEHLSSDPSVKIHGFPFLTQMVRGRYSDIEVVINDYQTNHSVPIDRIDVHLHGTEVPLSSVTGSVNRVPVHHVDAVVLFGFAALTSEHSGLRFSFAGGDQVRVSGSVHVGTLSVEASATGRVVLNGNSFGVSIDSVTVADGAARAAADAAVRRAFNVSTRVPSLPFHFHLTGVRATKSGIEVVGSADNVVLSRSGA